MLRTGYLVTLALCACSSGADVDGGTDAITVDSGGMDSGALDSTMPDSAPRDTGLVDTGPDDAADTAPPDVGVDAADGGCAVPLARGHRDGDGDGHGAGPALMGCPGAPGFATTDDDCDDADADVFPTQPMFFGTPRASGGYDYDCNGAEQAEHRLGALCASGGACMLIQAGFLPPIPRCGLEGTFASDCTGADSSCAFTEMRRVQRCH